MFEGKSIFPLFAVDRPMPTGTQPPIYTAGRSKPETVPADIVEAIDKLLLAEIDFCRDDTMEDGHLIVRALRALDAARSYLDAVILKHLRGAA